MLFGSSVCSISFSFLYSAAVMVMNSLFISWLVFVSSFILKDRSARYSNLYWQLFSFKAWKGLLCFRVWVEKSEMNLIVLPLNVGLHFFVAFNLIFFPFLYIRLLIIMCPVKVLFWSCLFGLLYVSYMWMCISFLRWGRFSAIIFMHLVFISIFSSVPVTFRFILLVLSQSSCIF